MAFRDLDSVGVLIASFRSSIPSPPIPLFTLRTAPRDALRKTRGRVVRYSFLVGLLHSLLHAGLPRRTEMATIRPSDEKSVQHDPFEGGRARVSEWQYLVPKRRKQRFETQAPTTRFFLAHDR